MSVHGFVTSRKNGEKRWKERGQVSGLPRPLRTVTFVTALSDPLDGETGRAKIAEQVADAVDVVHEPHRFAVDGGRPRSGRPRSLGASDPVSDAVPRLRGVQLQMQWRIGFAPLPAPGPDGPCDLVVDPPQARAVAA